MSASDIILPINNIDVRETYSTKTITYPTKTGIYIKQMPFYIKKIKNYIVKTLSLGKKIKIDNASISSVTYRKAVDSKQIRIYNEKMQIDSAKKPALSK